MQENRWQKIQEVFNRAVVLPAAERRGFVEEICRDEPGLCREVTALVDSDCLEDSFLDEPVFTLGVQLLEDDFSEFLKKEEFGYYRLQKLLGRGGMGAVFLAEDIRLERFVAIKILPPAFADNEKIVERFRREARLASSISHPNVAHIYEFSQIDGRYFLAMEYVRGATLRELIKENSVDRAHAVEIARQIANALAAAHKVGIVHRDIKPENVMITEDGLVKTLDFGISKLAAQITENHEPETENQSASDSALTALAGTVAYMSPEQASGQPADERTDLWSLGIVLYEMLTGKRPFDGIALADVRHKILEAEPSFDLPAPLAQVLRRALQKEPAKRYQTAAEFAADLTATQDELKADEPRPTATRQSFSGALPKFTIAILAVALLCGCWLIAQYLGKPAASTKLTARKSTRLNLTSKARSTALAPSGKWLAYSFDENGKLFLILKPNDAQVNSAATERTLVESGATRIAGLVFSPDEHWIYYTLYEANKIYADLYRVAIEGGEPQKLLSKIENAPGFSPDGKQIVFLRLGEDESHESLIIADADGRSERVLHTRRMPEYITHLATPAWSPDGTTVLCAAGLYGADKKQQAYPMKISVESGEAVPAFSEPWHEIWQTAWLGDGRFFVMVGRKISADNNKQIWLVDAKDGSVSRVTDDFNDYFGVSVADKMPDKSVQIGTLVLDRATDLWIAEIGGKNETARQITSNADNSYGVSWARNNQIVYGSVAGNNYDIWAINADGAPERRQITREPARDSFPTQSPDGSQIFFISERDGVKSLWRVNAAADGEPVALVRGVSQQPFAASSDGKWIYFHSYFSGSAALWRVSVSGGAEPEKIADGVLESPAIASDNRTIAAIWKNEEGESKLVVFSADDPARENWKTLDLIAGANPSAASSPTALRWMANGSEEIAYVVQKKGIGNLWAQNVKTGKARQLTNFTTARVWSFDFSPDGSQIVCSRGDQQRFVTLIQLGEAE